MYIMYIYICYTYNYIYTYNIAIGRASSSPENLCTSCADHLGRKKSSCMHVIAIIIASNNSNTCSLSKTDIPWRPLVNDWLSAWFNAPLIGDSSTKMTKKMIRAVIVQKNKTETSIKIITYSILFSRN